MSEITSRGLRPPNDWQAFERLTYDLFRKSWKTDDAHLHGRSGQEQHGVDVYGTDRTSGKLVGLQCKGKNSDYGSAVTFSELSGEVEKAKKFRPALHRFVLVTTAPNDAKIQAKARELHDQNRNTGLFEVDIMGWEDIKHLIQDHPEVLETYYSGMSPGVPQMVTEAIEEEGERTRAHFTNEFERILPTPARGDAKSYNAAAPDRSATDDALGRRITDIADLLKDTPPRTVLARLEKLWGDEARTASHRHRYRIKAIIGSAHWVLGDRRAACASFRDAHDELPEDGDGIAILASAEMIDGNAGRAFELAQQALALNQNSDRAAGVLVETARDELRWVEVQALLPQKFRDEPAVLVALAERALAHGDAKAANRMTFSALKRDPNNWRVLVRAGLLHFSKVADKEEIRFLRMLRQENRKAVENASRLFSDAWDAIKKTGWPAQGDWIAANLAATHLLLGTTDIADQILDEALALCGRTPSLLHMKALRHMDLGEWSGARRALTDLPQQERDANDQLMLIQAQTRDGAADEALSTAILLYADSDDAELRTALGTARLLAASELSDEALDNEASIVLEDYPESAVLIATYVGLRPNAPQRADLTDRLIKALPNAADAFTRDRVAHALYGIGEYSAAADLFTSLCDAATDSPQLRLALRSLTHCKRLREARKLYQKVDKSVRDKIDFRRIGAWILEESGQLEEARKEFEPCLGEPSEDLADRLFWLNLCIRIPDLTATEAYLTGVDTDISGNPRARMQLAVIMDRVIDEPLKVLEIGYRALRDDYNDPQLHAGFIIHLFFMGRAGRTANLERTIVELDTAVVLSGNNREDMVRVIETAPNPQPAQDEIAPDDPLAQRLMGKHVGDQIEMEGLGATYTLTVKEILSKFVHAQARALRDCDRMFPENKFLGALRFDEDDVEGSLKPVLDSVRRRGESARRIEEAYKSTNAPLCFLAAIGGGTPFDLWDHVRHHPDLRVLVAAGDAAERRNAARAIQNRTSAIIDPVTLYGLIGLGLFDTLLTTLPDLMITRSSIDLLQEALIDREDSFRDLERSGVLVAVDDKFHIIERSKEQGDMLCSQLSETLEAARRLDVVMPESGGRLSVELDELFSKVAPCFVDTLIVAKEQDVPLLTDDLALRKVASLDEISSTWTQATLLTARNSGALEQTVYADAVVVLLDSTYEYTSVDTGTLLHEWDAAGHESSDRVQKILEKIASPANDLGSVADLLAGALIEAWRGEGGRERCLRLTDLALAAFQAERGKEAAEEALVETVRRSVSRNQRAGRIAVLPKRLKLSTSLTTLDVLMADVDYARRREIEETIGACVRTAISRRRAF